MQSERIKEAVEILPGDVFQMSKVKMEVVQVVDGAQNGAATFGDMPAADPNDIDPPEEREPTPRPQARPVAAKAPAKAAAKSAPPVSAKKPSKASPPPAEERGGKKPNSGTQATNMPDDAAVDRSIGYFFVAVPKAVAYYLANIPLLLVNPIGRVRKIIEEQPADPMGRMELIAYAIPPLVIQQVLPSLAVGIVLAVHGTISIMSFIPIVPLIVAVISAVISGFIWHPFVKWVVNFLKGESDERSRTNYFLMTMTANAVLAVPTFVATMLGLIPFRLVAIVGVLLSLVASLAILFVHWSWFTYFNVVKWFRTVLLVVGALSVLGGLASGVMLLINGNGGVSTTTTTIAVGDGTNGLTAEQQAQIDAAQKQADAMMKQAGAANGDAADQIKAMQEKGAGTDQGGSGCRQRRPGAYRQGRRRCQGRREGRAERRQSQRHQGERRKGRSAAGREGRQHAGRNRARRVGQRVPRVALEVRGDREARHRRPHRAEEQGGRREPLPVTHRAGLRHRGEVRQAEQEAL